MFEFIKWAKIALAAKKIPSAVFSFMKTYRILIIVGSLVASAFIAQYVIAEKDGYSFAINNYLMDNIHRPLFCRAGHSTEDNPLVSGLDDWLNNFPAVAHLRREETRWGEVLTEQAPVGLEIQVYLPVHFALRNKRENGVILSRTGEL